MTDVVLVRAALKVLVNNAGRGIGMTEELVGIEIETMLRRPCTAQQVRGALSECRKRNWAVEESDTWGQPMWRATEAGVKAEGQV
jgi:hypothetical protein